MGEFCLYSDAAGELEKARRLPKSTKQEKEIRDDAIKLAKLKRSASRLITKYGRENIILPDESVKEEIQSRDASTFAEAMKVRKELRDYAKAVSIYERATKPYAEAKLLLTQATHYMQLDELEAKAASLMKS